MNYKIKKNSYLLIPIVIVPLFIIAVNNFFDTKLQMLLKEKDITSFCKEYENITRDRSVLFKNFIENKQDVLLMGSSELKINVPQNSKNLFPFKGAEYNVVSNGRAGVQNLQQTTALGATDARNKQKIVYIVSSQWFGVKNGVDSNSFAANFSDIEFYNFLNNKKISKKNKQYYAKRVFECLKDTNQYSAEVFYARMYISNNPLKYPIMIAMDPYYKITKYLLNVKDKTMLCKELNRLNNNKNQNMKLQKINWDKEYTDIEKKINNTKFTNEFYINEEYYNKNKKYISKKEKTQKNVDLLKSKELNDYKFFLSVSEELNIDLYIIVLPVNGWFYDYTGLTKDKRIPYYDEIEKLASEKRFNYLDLREYEYKKGFLTDVAHFGEEGWLKVSEEIYKNFDEK